MEYNVYGLDETTVRGAEAMLQKFLFKELDLLQQWVDGEVKLQKVSNQHGLDPGIFSQLDPVP